MRIPIRYFAIGMLTASIALFIMYMITDEPNDSAEALSVEELANALEEKGYRIISQDDFISYSVYLDEQKQKEDEENKKEADTADQQKQTNDETEDRQEKDPDEATKVTEKPKKEEETKKEKKAKSITIQVKEGYVSQDIAKVLKDEGIIKDEAAFVKYMEDNNHSPYIQIGKFKVTSDMDLKELADTLTTYPGN